MGEWSFFHIISHNLKAIAWGFDIDKVFQNDFHLSHLTPFQRKNTGHSTKHEEAVGWLR